MCKECGRQICAPNCPQFDHFLAGIGGAEGFCVLCGSAIYPNEGYYRRGRVSVCNDCEAAMTMNELRLLLGTRDALLSCGFERID